MTNFNTFKATLAIAIPLILGNLTQVAYGLIDTAMIGTLGYKQLAAASLVVNVLAIPLVIGIGLTMAITPLVAIANGQNNPHKASHVLYNGWTLSLVCGVVLALVVHAISFYLPYMGQDPEVAALSKNYLIIMGYSLIPMMVFGASKNFADGLQYTQTAMVLSMASLPLNAFLCWVFIYGHLGSPTFGVFGAGMATFISRVLLAIAMAIVVLKHKTFHPFISLRKQAWQLNKATFREMLGIGIPSSLQYCMEAGAFSISGIMVGWLGAVPQAAHQIALNCASTTFMASLGFSMAGSIRVSDAFGKGDGKSLALIGKSTAISGLLYGFLAALLMVAFGSYLPYAFTKDAEVVRVASILLVYAAIFQISDATQAIGVGLCRGVKDVVMPTIYVAIAYWGIGIPVGYLLAFHYQMGVSGIWIGFVTGLTFSAVLLNFRFFKNLHKIVARL
ncbi:MATE family efflux transporter [Parasediminibacterium sp. JCM 36343]|uniref:MATE family efflux transporter n=1 Tax=Parasediminibacterium sp. JCM 36343 TaxID=3374279 RepID=UPI00397A001F